MGAAMFCFGSVSSAVLYWVASRFLTRLVEWKCYSYNLKTCSDYCSRWLFIQVMGQETCQWQPQPPPQSNTIVLLIHSTNQQQTFIKIYALCLSFLLLHNTDRVKKQTSNKTVCMDTSPNTSWCNNCSSKANTNAQQLLPKHSSTVSWSDFQSLPSVARCVKTWMTRAFLSWWFLPPHHCLWPSLTQPDYPTHNPTPIFPYITFPLTHYQVLPYEVRCSKWGQL